jgi:hypothetical protein
VLCSRREGLCSAMYATHQTRASQPAIQQDSKTASQQPRQSFRHKPSKNQATVNPKHTVYDVKRPLGAGGCCLVPLRGWVMQAGRQAD